ncbi:unnamed protein product, partial [Closterium sp. NIES-53]
NRWTCHALILYIFLFPPHQPSPSPHQSMLPVLMRMQQVVDVRGRMDACIDEGDFARALRLCSHCLVLIEQNAQLASIRDMNISIEEWLTRVVDHVDALLFTVCKSFDSPSYAVVIDAYAVMDDAATLADKVQNFFAQSVVTCTYDTLLQFLEQVCHFVCYLAEFSKVMQA